VRLPGNHLITSEVAVKESFTAHHFGELGLVPGTNRQKARLIGLDSVGTSLTFVDA